MKITLNNKSILLDGSLSVSKLLLNQGISPNGIAVAINDQVIFKVNWESTYLAENDKVVVITAVFGG